MGVKISNHTPIYTDNMGMILNATSPGSTLNEKMVVLFYHFVCEHVANNVVEDRNINTNSNFANPFTKSLVSNDLCGGMSMAYCCRTI